MILDRDRHDASHRCEGSLAHRTSVRHYGAAGRRTGWWLLHWTYDFEWDSWYTEDLGGVSFCPWCGTRLGAM